MESTIIQNEENAIDNLNKEKDYWENQLKETEDRIKSNDKIIDDFKKKDEQVYQDKMKLVSDLHEELDNLDLPDLQKYMDLPVDDDHYLREYDAEEVRSTYAFINTAVGFVDDLFDRKVKSSETVNNYLGYPNDAKGFLFDGNIALLKQWGNSIKDSGAKINHYLGYSDEGNDFFIKTQRLNSIIKDIAQNKNINYKDYSEYEKAHIRNNNAKTDMKTSNDNLIRIDKELNSRSANIRRHTKWSKELQDAKDATSNRLTEVRKREQ